MSSKIDNHNNRGDRHDKRSFKTPLIAGGVIAGAGVAYMLLKSGRAKTVARDAHVETSILINRPPSDVYSFWRDFKNLPLFMKTLESVDIIDDQRSHWTIKGVAGASIEWDAEIYNEIPGQLISWRSTENADVVNAGTVRFAEAPGGRGTNVRITLNYNPPGGVVGTTVTELFGDKVESSIRDDLRRFKQLMETGEVATIEGQSSGIAEPPTVPEARSARVVESEGSEGLSRSATAQGATGFSR